MKVKALGVFKSKLFKPCKKIIFFFRLRPKKPVFIRALKFRALKPKRPTMSSLLQSVFRSPKKPKHTDMLPGLKSPSNVHETPLFPSPLTPAYVRTRAAKKREEASRQEVEDACRSFENYLVEMIVEEGKTKDLMDVEELLYCWKNLKCPVFVDLVCRFYGELCKDLFSPDSEEGDSSK
ncbi:transcription repressor OFP17-like [Abrus precatorius]|uniref:Transcription repressor OFP17-like n=1 Tax=Abrus precatorius TaxID=3816 RepID=A0A8B8JPG1_ABRPR|nr:transcription repressor OFP17-like [Abrus precatorius]